MFAIRPVARHVSRAVGGDAQLFNPTSWFKDGGQGFIMDCNESGLLFMDSVGRNESKIGSTVGIVLSKTGKFTPLTYPNMDLSLGTDEHWIHTSQHWIVTPGKAYHPPITTLNAFNYPVGVSDKYRRVTFDLELVSGAMSFQALGFDQTVTTSGTHTFLIQPASPTLIFKRTGGATPFEGYLSNVRIEEYDGPIFYQETSASRPTLREVGGKRVLRFDGVDDYLESSLMSEVATTQVSIGVRANSTRNNATGVVVELGTDSNTVNNTFGLYAPASSGQYQMISRGSSAAYARHTEADKLDAYVVGVGDLKQGTAKVYADGVLSQVATTGASSNPVPYDSAAKLYIGRRAGASLPFRGDIEDLVIINKALTDQEVLNLSNYANRVF